MNKANSCIRLSYTCCSNWSHPFLPNVCQVESDLNFPMTLDYCAQFVNDFPRLRELQANSGFTSDWEGGLDPWTLPALLFFIRHYHYCSKNKPCTSLLLVPYHGRVHRRDMKRPTNAQFEFKRYNWQKVAFSMSINYHPHSCRSHGALAGGTRLGQCHLQVESMGRDSSAWCAPLSSDGPMKSNNIYYTHIWAHKCKTSNPSRWFHCYAAWFEWGCNSSRLM